MPVKTDRLAILLVHVGGEFGRHRQRMIDERPPDAAPAMRRVNEQRLHMGAVEQHEAGRYIVAIDRKPKWRSRQKVTHFRFDCRTVGGAQEIMRCVDSGAPYRNHPRGIFCPRLTNSGR